MSTNTQSATDVKKPVKRLPDWLKKSLAPGKQSNSTESLLSDLGLNTICQSGKCPNRNECYSQNTASFMILGDRCTRNCHYCSVAPGKPLPPDPNEPANLAAAVKKLGLEHVVITSVTRDDLKDEGLSHFKEVVMRLRNENPDLIIEILTPDFRRDPDRAAKAVAEFPIQIFNHNIETVRSAHSKVRPQGGYDLSLSLLKRVKELNPNIISKSGAMLGLGESSDEVAVMLKDLRDHGCEMLTLGQYLRPDLTACEVRRYVEPQEFEKWKNYAFEIGFKLVESGPFIRSSYHAKDSFTKLKQLIAQSKD